MIGFGEAAATFARNGGWTDVSAYDVKSDAPATRDAKTADYVELGVRDGGSCAGALTGQQLVFSLVTADQALAAARAVGDTIEPGAMFLDGNSVAPETKEAAARFIESRGGHYVDMAIMAPVLPAALAVPVLLSGPAAEGAAGRMREIGFSRVSVVSNRIGFAASVKMIRSVMVKGIEALGAELAIAARRAGVLDAVLASLDESWREQSWRDRIDYGLDRMAVHGIRRAAEMEEVARTLIDLGLDPRMTRGTIEHQRALGELGVEPPEGLAAKLAIIDPDARKPTE